MEAFVGKWKFEEGEHFDEVMQRLGVGFLTRQAGKLAKPTLIISELGDGKYKMRSESTFKNTEFEFKLGEEFEEETPDGRKVKSTITLDGDTLKQVQVGEKTTYIDRVIEGNKLKTTVKVEELVSTRIYVKV